MHVAFKYTSHSPQITTLTYTYTQFCEWNRATAHFNIILPETPTEPPPLKHLHYNKQCSTPPVTLKWKTQTNVSAWPHYLVDTTTLSEQADL